SRESTDVALGTIRLRALDCQATVQRLSKRNRNVPVLHSIEMSPGSLMPVVAVETDLWFPRSLWARSVRPQLRQLPQAASWLYAVPRAAVFQKLLIRGVRLDRLMAPRMIGQLTMASRLGPGLRGAPGGRGWCEWCPPRHGDFGPAHATAAILNLDPTSHIFI